MQVYIYIYICRHIHTRHFILFVCCGHRSLSHATIFCCSHYCRPLRHGMLNSALPLSPFISIPPSLRVYIYIYIYVYTHTHIYTYTHTHRIDFSFDFSLARSLYLPTDRPTCRPNDGPTDRWTLPAYLTHEPPTPPNPPADLMTVIARSGRSTVV